MYVYAGIDEAGYGPLLGPLLIGRAVLCIDTPPPESAPDLWQLLSRAVCRKASDKRGRIAVDDSKKLHSKSAGIRHLERTALSFAAAAGCSATDAGAWLDFLGERSHRQASLLPWYAPDADSTWDPLPLTLTAGELAVSRNMLAQCLAEAGVTVASLGAAVVFEDRFNRMVTATRSKAATSFTFVSTHLRDIWDRYGEHAPFAVVDRQSGRMRYLDLLRPCFPEARFTVLDETPHCSAYRLEAAGRGMTVRFEVDSEQQHLPTALASIVSKYCREMLMARFQAWFLRRLPDIKPTAGYAQDGKRFIEQIEPMLPKLGITREQLVRVS